MFVNNLYSRINYYFCYTKSIKLLKNYDILQWIYGDLSFLKNKNDETIWGRNMAKSIPNYNPKNNWSFYLGEEISKELLAINAISSRQPIMKYNLLPDLETDYFMVEVKTLMYKNKNATIAEKILGSSYKYANIPIIYHKPLLILCVGGAEDISRNKYKIIGPNHDNDNRKLLLDTYKKIGIAYIGARDLLNNANNHLI